MILAPIPPNEAQRLRALRELLILDTPPEARFDRIADFAAGEFDVAIALVSLVDEKRQWFKAAIGLGLPETPRGPLVRAHSALATAGRRDRPGGGRGAPGELRRQGRGRAVADR